MAGRLWHNPHVNLRPRAPRAEPRAVAELKQLKLSQPELASAVDMQLALVDVQRRVQSRVPLPRIGLDPASLRDHQDAGRPLVRFADIPLDWTDFRLALRQTADILLRFDALEPTEHDRISALLREGNTLEPLVEQWYVRSSGDDASRAEALDPSLPNLDQVLVLAVRPFLARCAEVLMQRAELSTWHHGRCPVCGWEPDLAVITPQGDRQLICGRCLAQWPFGAYSCPYCANEDRSLITSFATRDGRYRVYACDRCRRYLKAYDARNAPRPVMAAVDSIATLPLDAAAMQRGYTG